MEEKTLNNWAAFKEWAQEQAKNRDYVYRGQASSLWKLENSLKRRFIDADVNDHEWRRRELKMYRAFRDRLLRLCPGLCDGWHPLYIMSLMQHYGAPTRMLDLTSSPWIAAFFAVTETRGDSAIWVINKRKLTTLKEENNYKGWIGPTHIDDYLKSDKDDRTILVIPRPSHVRIAAQKGLFLVSGHISHFTPPADTFVQQKIILPIRMAREMLINLDKRGIKKETMYPNLEELAEDVKQLSTIGSPDVPDK